LDVLLSREEAAIALPLVQRDQSTREEAARSRRSGAAARSPGQWLADIANDPEGDWRSPWLAACARHAIAQRGVGAVG
jgi:hypothetical protein